MAACFWRNRNLAAGKVFHVGPLGIEVPSFDASVLKMQFVLTRRALRETKPRQLQKPRNRSIASARFETTSCQHGRATLIYRVVLWRPILQVLT